jgi:4-diphosphocytidyl-2-C-methyl-D-erythritol kinase
VTPEAAVVRAPAKLTRRLRVTGTRPDGYHELDAEMVSLDLADELEIVPGPLGLEVRGEEAAARTIAGDDNLVLQALRAVGLEASVRLHKVIPIGGGLGGGSSDAAAVLRWAGCEDLTVASSLGADVPFCVRGGRARVRGIGEVLDPLPFEALDVVLLAPPLAVDTAAVYVAYDRGARPTRDTGNDLEGAALAVEPGLRAWRDWLGDMTGRQPFLAGSGATWFVQGTLEQLGLDAARPPRLDGRPGRLIEARSVDATWVGQKVVR